MLNGPADVILPLITAKSLLKMVRAPAELIFPVMTEAQSRLLSVLTSLPVVAPKSTSPVITPKSVSDVVKLLTVLPPPNETAVAPEFTAP